MPAKTKTESATFEADRLSPSHNHATAKASYTSEKLAMLHPMRPR